MFYNGIYEKPDRWDLRLSEAFEQPIDDCIADGILTEILRKEKVRIMASILAEFDEVEYKEMLRREMKEDALIEAREEVRRDFEEVKEKMIREAVEEVTREVREEGIQAIIETCRELGCSNSDIVSRLETKFSLKSEDARGYLDKF